MVFVVILLFFEDYPYVEEVMNWDVGPGRYPLKALILLFLILVIFSIRPLPDTLFMSFLSAMQVPDI